MKYESLSSFESHLTKQSQHELSHAYLIIARDSYDRTKVVAHIKKIFSHQIPQIEVLNLPLEEKGLSSFFSEVQNRSLFAEHKLLILDGVEFLKAEDLSNLEEQIKNLPDHIRLILSGSDLKGDKFYQALKTDLVMLDLRSEKPWTYRERVESSLMKMAKERQKTLTLEALHALIDSVGVQLSALESHLEKLICFIGDLPRIDKQAIDSFLYACLPFDGWKLADAVVFQTEKPYAIVQIQDNGELFTFLGQVRHRIYTALLLYQVKEEGIDPSEIAHLSHMKPQLIEKYTSLALKYPPSYYEAMLGALFEVELKMRKESYNPQDLIIKLLMHERAKTDFTSEPAVR